jgi:hypothetical protein
VIAKYRELMNKKNKRGWQIVNPVI